MISSSNFFRKTLFVPEDKQSSFNHQLPSPKKDSLTPWAPITDHVLHRLPSYKLTPDKQIQFSKQKNFKQKQDRLSTHLLPQRRLLSLSPPSPIKILTNENISKTLNPPMLGSLRKILKRDSYEQMSIRQFLSQQKSEQINEEFIQKMSMAKINSQLNHEFFVRRNNRRKGKLADVHSKTIEIRRDLMSPVETCSRKYILSLDPEVLQMPKKSDYGSYHQKYKPFHNSRYYQ